MIGVDTNVLLRLYVDDDEAQHDAAVAFFASRSRDDPAYVCLVVAVEFVWALDRAYGYPRTSILALLAGLLQAKDVRFERPDVIAEAVDLAGSDGVEVADAIIATVNAADGCRTTVTFDKSAARRATRMELLT